MSMNREECRLNGIREFGGYGLPPNTMMLVGNMGSMTRNYELKVHLQLMVKIKSNLGLQIVDKSSGEKMLPDKDPSEVHFLKMEGVLGSADISKSIWSFKSLFDLMMPSAKNSVSDWTLVDFDHFLRGNPHI